MKKRICLGIAICMILAGSIYYIINQQRQVAITEGIASKIIRLHVVANSDTKLDQSLKLRVKDQIVTNLQGKLKGVKNREQAKKIIAKNLGEIEQIAEKKMKSEGYDYKATAKLVHMDFPVKQYGDLTFPAGNYEALRVELGKAEGKNWWCVMYPSLCLIDSTYQIVPNNSKEMLKTSLTDREYDEILSGKQEVTYGCKLFDWVAKLLD